MLKIPTPHERVEMLARHIERTPNFNINYPRYCFWGHATRLFGTIAPQTDDEHSSDYLARMLGITKDEGLRLYYGFPHIMPIGQQRPGPIRTREQAAKALRALLTEDVFA